MDKKDARMSNNRPLPSLCIAPQCRKAFFASWDQPYFCAKCQGGFSRQEKRAMIRRVEKRRGELDKELMRDSEPVNEEDDV